MTRAALVDGEVAGVWGCAGSPMGGTGQPWLMTSAGFARVPILMVKACREDVAGWLVVFDHLENYVDATYAGACRFLEVVGFRLDPPKPIHTGHAFRRFHLERT